MTKHFDQAAQDWDNNPIHLERTQAIAVSLLEMVPLRKDMKAMEFGSGTGLLSFALKDYLAEITLMDSSIEMNRQAIAKIATSHAVHLKPLHFDLEKDEYSNGTFDVIFTQMAMHHVKDVPAMINKFYDLLNPGGYIVIADLFTEDGTFHDSNFDGHYGFEPDFIKDTLTTTGFSNAVLKPCFVIKRHQEDNGEMAFPVFIAVAKK
ncbi:MAG: class I SAM-dependent methyltransferase [Bacteroidetes bacterium]|nr:class I SAM-dependent methyltransferase [Bacteroidota bacterium]